MGADASFRKRCERSASWLRIRGATATARRVRPMNEYRRRQCATCARSCAGFIPALVRSPRGPSSRYRRRSCQRGNKLGRSRLDRDKRTCCRTRVGNDAHRPEWACKRCPEDIAQCCLRLCTVRCSSQIPGAESTCLFRSLCHPSRSCRLRTDCHHRSKRHRGLRLQDIGSRNAASFDGLANAAAISSSGTSTADRATMKRSWRRSFDDDHQSGAGTVASLPPAPTIAAVGIGARLMSGPETHEPPVP